MRKKIKELWLVMLTIIVIVSCYIQVQNYTKQNETNRIQVEINTAQVDLNRAQLEINRAVIVLFKTQKEYLDDIVTEVQSKYINRQELKGSFISFRDEYQ